MGTVCKALSFMVKEIYTNARGLRRPFVDSGRRLDGRVVVITGANTGIGKETARELAARGAKVYIGCRNLEKAAEAIADIRAGDLKADITAYKLDLASLKSIRAFAKQLTESVDAVDILVNNAGIMACPEWQTEEGFEMQFGTNHLGHFLLTLHLLPLLKKSPKARILTLSSSAHLTGKIHLNNINLRDGAYSDWKAYGQSKLANILFSSELAKRLGAHSHITTYSLHPGLVGTDLQRHAGIGGKLFNRMGLTPSQGSWTTLFCVLDEALDNETGHFYADCKRVDDMIKAATDEDCAERLWQMSVDLVSLEDHLKI